MKLFAFFAIVLMFAAVAVLAIDKGRYGDGNGHVHTPNEDQKPGVHDHGTAHETVYGKDHPH